MIDNPNNIYIEKGGVTTTLKPKNQAQAMITQTISDIANKGLPSNEELDTFGDKLWDALEKTKTSGMNKEVKKIVDETQDVLSNIKSTIKEKNYDGTLQEIARKLEASPTVEVDKELKEDAEKIGKTLKEVMTMIFDISKAMINDSDFRDMLVTILDIVQTSYERADRTTPSLKKSIKSDIKDPNSKGEHTKQALQKKKRIIKNFMNLNEDERNEILDKAAAALLRFKKHPEYQPLLQLMFQLYDELVDVWSKIEHKPLLKETYQDRSAVLPDIRTLIERASNTNLYHWINHIKDLQTMKDDSNYIQVRKDMEELLFDPKQKYQNEEDIKQAYLNIKKGLKNLNDDYNNIFNKFVNETRSIINGIAQDPQISKLANSLNKLVSDIFTDEHGKPTIEATTTSLARIKDIFFPVIKNQFSFLVFPNIEIESKKYFFRIENFNLHLDDIIPDQIKVESDSKLNIDIENMKRSGVFNFYIVFDDITTSIENLDFQLRKKTGIKYNDSGRVNISFEGASLKFSFRLTLEEDIVDYIEVPQVEVDLNAMKIKIIESDHEWIDSILTTIFLPYLKNKLTSTLENTLDELLNNGVCGIINNTIRKMEED